MARILVTGSTGFIGQALVPALRPRHEVVVALRRAGSAPSGTSAAVVGEIGPETDWSAALAGIERVVHLAGLAHQTGDAAAEAARFERINAGGTRRLGEACREAGVRQMVFVSTAKVMGERSGAEPFRDMDEPHPEGPYAISKRQAEQALAGIAAAGGPAVAILRPPLVYGAGARANLAALQRLVRSGLPLPFGAVRNRRSLIGIENLVSAIAAVLEAPPRPGCDAWLVSDGEDLSTADLVRHLAAAEGRPARLLPVPPALLGALLRLAGQGGLADRLLGSFAVNSFRFRADFAWQPPVPVAAGMAALAAIRYRSRR